MKILVIIHDPAGAGRIERLVLEEGGKSSPAIRIAPSLEAAGALLGEAAFDVVVTDLDLPEGRGEVALRKLVERAPSLPVVVLMGAEDEAGDLLKAGAQDCLSQADLTGRALHRALLYASEKKALEERLAEKDRALEDVREELMHLARKESTGHFAAGVAHEVKNPLAVIQMGLDCLRMINQKKPEGVTGQCLSRMQKALDRADFIVQELLDYSSDRALQWELADLNRVIERSISLISPHLAKKRIEVECRLGENLPPVRMDRRKIEQVTINILLNAQQALEGRALREIRVTTRPPAAATQGGDRVSLLIEDSGPGIPAGEEDRVFEAFYTTKGKGKGSGLGLTIVRTIVELHGGTVRLTESRLGGLGVEIGFPAGREACVAEETVEEQWNEKR